MIFLDEPTTYLDMAHQLEILELLERLNIEQERTIVMVLHDLNQAARFADYIIAMKDGDIIQAGDPEAVISHDVLKKVFHIDAEIGRDPRTAKPICITYNLLKGEKRMYSKRSKTTTTKKLLIPFIALPPFLALAAASLRRQTAIIQERPNHLKRNKAKLHPGPLHMSPRTDPSKCLPHRGA